MIKVALPNKGILLEPTIELLQSCGYKAARGANTLTQVDVENDVEFYYLRPGDIPVYISNGILDAGITGRDFVAEKRLEPALLLDLNYGHSRLCAAVPEGEAPCSLEDFARRKIATSFPVIVRSYFAPRELDLVELEGAVENAVRLGIAEAIVDVVDTGNTLRESRMRVVGEPLFASNAALFAHPGKQDVDEVRTMMRRIEGRLIAQEYLMVEYDVPPGVLSLACTITPGIESPTVSPLQTEGWYAVKAMILKRDANRIMDELSAAGCKGILLTTIESARI